MPTVETTGTTINKVTLTATEVRDAVMAYVQANGYPDVTLPDFGEGENDSVTMAVLRGTLVDATIGDDSIFVVTLTNHEV